MNKNLVPIIISFLIVGAAIFYVGTLEDGEPVQPEEEMEESGEVDEIDEDEDETAESDDNSEENLEDIEEENGEMSGLIDCLAENDLVIYGAEWCPACTQLAESFGGYEAIDPIYVECAEGTPEEAQRCEEETETGYVPEIQIAGDLYEGVRDPASLGSEVGCQL